MTDTKQVEFSEDSGNVFADLDMRDADEMSDTRSNRISSRHTHPRSEAKTTRSCQYIGHRTIGYIPHHEWAF